MSHPTRRDVCRGLLALGALPACARGDVGEAAASQPPRAPVPVAQADPDEPEASRPPPSFVVGDCDFYLEIGAQPPVSEVFLAAWIAERAQMVSDYFAGRFPVPRLDVEVVTGGRGSLGWGQHWDGRRVEVHVGRRATEADLHDDWVLAHEMLHTAIPDLERRHKWMQEGLSTYLEPVVRVRAGNRDEAEAWGHFAKMMPNGLPGPGDRGLDHTRTWGRVYWGGTIFWLVADIRMLQQTGLEVGLRETLTRMLEQEIDGRLDWSIAQTVEACDRASGTAVLSELHAELADRPGTVDLDRLWADLGVVGSADDATLDEDAPLAHIRRHISGRA